MNFTIPVPVTAAYKGHLEVMGATHNDQGTVYHIWTYHGFHDRWECTNGTWVRTFRR